MNTTIINLWAGPGAGKSTTAALVYGRMKQAGVSCELVTEYVKQWAWRNRPITHWDEPYIFAHQLQRESCLYGKVDYVITDSPLGLSVVYERRRDPNSDAMHHLFVSVQKKQEAAGIRTVNCFLQRSKPYVQAGRYEDESQAREMDGRIEYYLRSNRNRPFNIVKDSNDVLRAAGLVGLVAP